jgi:hypothetical protein
VNCGGITFIGPDGSTYYGGSAPMDPTSGAVRGTPGPSTPTANNHPKKTSASA